MPITVVFLSDEIYSTNPRLRARILGYVRGHHKIHWAEGKQAEVATIQGGAHESWTDHEFHWTIRYDKDGLEADHIKCPLWGIPEHRRHEFLPV